MSKIKRFKPVLICLILIFIFSSCSNAPQKSEKADFAMGTVISAVCYGNDENNEDIINSVIKKIKDTDLILSKNNENAELFKANHNNGVSLSNELYNYIKKSYEIYSLSNGKVSVSSGALTETWGFDNDNFRVPSDTEISEKTNLCKDSDLIFDDANKTISMKKGQTINLGSIGKGAACDEAVKEFKQISPNGSLIVSVGGSVGIVSEETRSVGIRNPFGKEDEYFGILKMKSGFVSTSGDYEKTFQSDGKAYHHILDLTTGYPVSNELTSVTVFSNDGYVSDALSTMCFALGIEESCKFLSLYNSEAIFVKKDKTVIVTDGLKGMFEITNSDFKLV